MVNDAGQFYSMEGIAAAILMVVTATLVLSATTLYTPQDVHISDMQLEQLGYDTLKIMDTPLNSSAESSLETMIRTNDYFSFDSAFLNYLNTKTNGMDTIQYSATIYFRKSTTGTINQTIFYQSRNPSGNENGVRVSRWIFINNTAGFGTWSTKPSSERIDTTRNQTVLLEVFLWRE